MASIRGMVVKALGIYSVLGTDTLGVKISSLQDVGRSARSTNLRTFCADMDAPKMQKNGQKPLGIAKNNNDFT